MKYIFVALLLVLAGCTTQVSQTSDLNAPRSSDAPAISALVGDSGGYTGKVIAGKTAQYREFNRADYDKALSEGKIVVLDFYATWCPICRAEEPVITKGFENLTDANIVGFRVNFKDNNTDESETALAKELNVPIQHTKVILKDGKEVYRSSLQWREGDFEKALGSVK